MMGELVRHLDLAGLTVSNCMLAYDVVMDSDEWYEDTCDEEYEMLKTAYMLIVNVKRDLVRRLNDE